MKTLNPYLSFNGNCEAAFNFYKSILGGEFSSVSRYNDMPSEEPVPDSEKNKILHMALPISEHVSLMGADTSELYGPKADFGNNVALSINTTDQAEALRIFTGLSAGGTIVMPFEAVFWGGLFGMFVDQFGVHWMVSCETENN